MTDTFTVAAAQAALLETARSASEALVERLPTVNRLTAVPRVAGATELPVEDWLAEHAVVGTFVGQASYRVALAVRPELLPTAGDGDDVTIDYVRTALEDAMGTFGAGVLTGLRLDDARTLFADPNAAVVRLDDAGSWAGAFGVLQSSGRPGASGDVLERLARLSGVEMDLTVQIGRTRLAVRDVLGLEPGSVIELDRSAGAPADILLNGRVIAHGEVVVVDQDYAVRITSIVDGATRGA